MPHPDVAGEVWKVTLAFHYPNEQWQLPSFHLQSAQANPTDTKPLVAAQVDSLITAHIVPTLPAAAIYYGSKVSPAYTTPPWNPYITTPKAPGTSTSDQLPTQVRPLLSMHTAKSGRAWRGRMYGASPAALFANAEGGPLATLGSAWLNAMDVWRAGSVISGTTWSLVLVHKQKPAPAPLIPPDLVTVLEFQDRFATQRRSGQYGRLNSEPW
jgi:hypothetical protein